MKQRLLTLPLTRSGLKAFPSSPPPACGRRRGKRKREIERALPRARGWASPNALSHSFQILGIVALAAVITALSAFAAEDPEISSRRAAQRTTFTDAEIADGFFKTAFGAEMHRGGQVDRIRKYDVPVRVYVDHVSGPDRRQAVSKTIADIKRHIEHIDIAPAQRRGDANVVVTLVRERDFPRAVRNLYGGDTRNIMKTLDPQCLSGFRKDATFRIVHSQVILVTDVDNFTFLDCAYEELLQALGPINDDDSVPWTMFNDDVQMGFFDIYDQYILNILYHPRVRPGMRPDEVRALLPDILPEVRAFIGRVNDNAQ